MRPWLWSSYDEALLVEQLRLLLQNIKTSAIAPIAVALTLLWILFKGNIGQSIPLILWCTLVVGSELASVLYTRRVLSSGLRNTNVNQIAWKLLALCMLTGAAWGSLVWVALDSATPIQNILINSILAGIAASSMALLSASQPMFVGFVVMQYIVAASKFWQMENPEYNALLIALTIYLIGLLAQSRHCSNAVVGAIKLRFENTQLLENLRKESEKAHIAHQEAVRANKAKSKFLAAASHDLRQPVHALGLFLEVLRNGSLCDDQRKVLDSARAVSDASAEMLNTLLDISRIEAGVIDVQKRPFQLQTMFSKIERELAPQGDSKNLIYRTRETDAQCLSDPRLIELILRNLVTNAIRYTVSGGILVAARIRPACVIIEVWDTGIGIHSSQFEAIFRDFHQLGNADRDRSKGLGLGLAIADGLARQLDHRLSLVSIPGRGSVFRLVVPRVQQAMWIEEPDIIDLSFLPLHAHILVIDDDLAVRSAMAQLLMEWQCSCDQAESPEKAIAAVNARRPDVIISDFHLRSPINGAQLIAILKKEIKSEIPTLLITGGSTPEHLREVMRTSIVILHKPVAAKQLYSVLAQALNQKRI